MACYKLRTLGAEDMFPMFKIISKIGIDEFASVFDSKSVKELANVMGKAKDGDEKKKIMDSYSYIVGGGIALKMMNIVISNIYKCEDDIYSFLASLSGLDKKEVKEMPMVEFTKMIIDVIKKDEFKDFLKVVSESLLPGM